MTFINIAIVIAVVAFLTQLGLLHRSYLTMTQKYGAACLALVPLFSFKFPGFGRISVPNHESVWLIGASITNGCVLLLLGYYFGPIALLIYSGLLFWSAWQNVRYQKRENGTL